LLLWIKINSELTLLFFRFEPVSDLLADQGGVFAGAVVENEVHLDPVFYSLVHDLNGIFDHLPGQDTVLVKEQFNLVNNVIYQIGGNLENVKDKFSDLNA